MKRLIVAAMTLSAIMTGCKTENPLLGDFNTPQGTPPFQQIKLEHYMPAFEEGIKQSRADIEAIVSNPETPTFENTIETLERNGSLLNRTANIFFALNSAETSDEMDEIANNVQPMLTELGNDISLNPDLFKRVKDVYEFYTRSKFETDPLDTEQRMLLEDTYKNFSRNGAALNDEDKAIYRELTKELSGTTLKFEQNALAATNAFRFNIPAADSAKVLYMPEFVVTAMAEEAKEGGEQGWTITLHAPSYIPFLTYSKERDLKQILWKASNSKCYGAENDNRENIKRITELRFKIANLLGYETHAAYVLEEHMAENTATVNSFLNELLVSTKYWAKAEYGEVVDYAKADGVADMMPWDFAYYSEKLKYEKYALSDEMVKPYLKLENVEKGTFMLAEKLYGITFKENKEIEVYHPDVKVYEVFDKDGSFLSVLYMDYFPRSSKRGGAWMTSFREMYTTPEGKEVRPLVTLNFNFTKPVGDMPSLLTFDEFKTVLHEFGHGLHGMFAKGKYESLTGTGVFRDFVELPSQVLENWAIEKEFLDLFAVHYQSGDKMPGELVKSVVAAGNYLSAYANARQLSFGMADMAWHSITAPITEDIAKFERNAIAPTQIAPVVEGTCMATAFTHIFSGGYAAGYYGYKWAEVLDADAYSLFKEKGIFNTEVAESFRNNILSKGGSAHPMTLYVNFRGHKPKTKALIDRTLYGRDVANGRN